MNKPVNPSHPVNAHKPSTLLCGMKRHSEKNEMSGMITTILYGCPNPEPMSVCSLSIWMRLKFSRSR
jgi:hypothetical protein